MAPTSAAIWASRGLGPANSIPGYGWAGGGG
uniref:Uncharacterized protein n=1 Tax=Human herpesvirus 2 TaxID=10310 RepID=A0A481T4E5_HHV2|nr:hypothetical protein [Human alphaherpesvirus 2]QBH78494.1 hypothetical protein [Human alphaherpesvirus 2]QBH80107.1 hypothetical protein [Human alphaherpesvirus 2]QBH82932.1 hypothetical protein [Human alphaherpesvirus 2]QBH84525.1 hypothetical protein [Human alphaherpesvirus 2]